jgi:hypothetical protein
MSLAAAYSNTLNDPFECEGVRLGWGCLVPSTVATAYLRTTLTSNADGSFAVVALPAPGAPAGGGGILYYNNSGSSTATWTGLAATDVAAINGSFGAGRVISMGIKAFPSIAATAAPGASFAGALVGQSLNTLSALTPNDLEALPDSQMGIGSNGATSTGRPVDTTSFEFFPAMTNAVGFAAAAVFPYSMPYVCFEGLPASSPVVVEIVINFEGLQLNTHAASGLGQGESYGDVLSASWASVEQLWQHIRPALTQVAKNTVASAAAGLSNTLSSFASRQLQMPMSRRIRLTER